MMNLFTCACGVFTLFGALIWASHIPYEDDGKIGWVILGVLLLSGVAGLVLGFALPCDGLAIGIVGTILWSLLFLVLIFNVVVLGCGGTVP